MKPKTITVRNDTILASEITSIGLNERLNEPENVSVYISIRSGCEQLVYVCKDKQAALAFLVKVKAVWIDAINAGS
jgi:hypothetical protein